MVMATVDVGDQAIQATKKETINVKAPLGMVDVAQVGKPKTTPILKALPRPAPPNYKCFNCNREGHFMRNCPDPKVRCRICNRMGHRAESCTKLQYAGPLGRIRPGFLRMTRSRIHLDLVDEATKRALFESMKFYLEGQEKAYDVAKEKAKKKRDEKRAEALLEGLAIIEEVTTEDVVQAVREVKPGEATTVATTALEVANPRTPSHYLDIEIAGKKVPALLYSGTAVSLLPSSLWTDIPLDEKTIIAKTDPGSYPLTGLGGVLYVETIVELPIAAAGCILLQRPFVITAPFHPILGMDAFHNLGLSIDFSTENVYTQGASNPIQQSEELGMSPLYARIEDIENTIPKPQFKAGTGCLPKEEDQVRDLFRQIQEVWEYHVSERCDDTGDATPIRARVRRLPPEKVEEVKRPIKTLTESGAIQPSNSPWASSIVLVPKANGTTRLCVDFRVLNKVTRKDAFPLPRITELLDRLATIKVFTTIDLAAGFHQIPLDKASIPKTAFIILDGLYEYKVLPIGLANAPSVFQRITDALFRDPPLCCNETV